jgi:hypothetical protein
MSASDRHALAERKAERDELDQAEQEYEEQTGEHGED